MEKSNFSFDKRVESLGLNKSDKVLIAYSGGGDSTFLLMQALNYFYDGNIYVAYVDYHDSEYTPEEEKIVLDFIRNKIYTSLEKMCIYRGKNLILKPEPGI